MIDAQIHNAIKKRMPHVDVKTEVYDYGTQCAVQVAGNPIAYRYRKYVGYPKMERNPISIDEFADLVAKETRGE